jgi:hypothetical protein
MLRTICVSTLLAVSGVAAAHAGGMAEPVMEAEVIAEAATATAGGWILPLIFIAVVAAVASSSGGDAPVPGPQMQ